jgi:hypothetical protein
VTTLQTPWRDGEKFGFRYVFEHAGDGLPEHAHSPELEHDVSVLRGRVAIIMENFVRVLGPGERCDFNSWKMHRILALTPAEIVNKLEEGLPADYFGLSDAELSGELDVPIDFNLENA